MMRITIERQPLEQIEAEALIVPVFEGRKEARFGAGDLADAGEVAGKSLELTLLHHPPGVAATRVLLAGAGKPEKFDCAELRKVAGAAVRHLKSKSVKTIALALDPEHADGEYAAAAVEGAILGEFEPDRYKTDATKRNPWKRSRWRRPAARRNSTTPSPAGAYWRKRRTSRAGW